MGLSVWPRGMHFGLKEVARTVDLSEREVLRAVRSGQFPSSFKYKGKRVWTAGTISDYLCQQFSKDTRAYREERQAKYNAEAQEFEGIAEALRNKGQAAEARGYECIAEALRQGAVFDMPQGVWDTCSALNAERRVVCVKTEGGPL